MLSGKRFRQAGRHLQSMINRAGTSALPYTSVKSTRGGGKIGTCPPGPAIGIKVLRKKFGYRKIFLAVKNILDTF